LKTILLTLIAISAFAYPNCMMCHNGGYKSKLDKYSPQEIVNMMQQYKTQSMGTMAKIANSMSDEEIKEVAKKYGKK